MTTFILVDSAIEFVVLFGLWILFVGNTSHSELLIGAICAMLGAIADALVKASDFGRFYVRLKGAAQSVFVPWNVVKDTATLMMETVRRALGKSDRSRWLVLPYRRTKDTEADRADRALATALTTMSPNEIVVGIDRKRRKVYVHQLVPRSVSKLLLKLGAEK